MGIKLQFGDFVVGNKDYNLACLGKARDYLTLMNLRMICMDKVIMM